MNCPRYKILLLSGWYYPDSVGGTEVYVKTLAQELVRLGHEVTIAAPSQDEAGRTYTYENILIYRYPISLNPSLAEIRGDVAPKYLEHLDGWISKNKPDIAHLHAYTRGLNHYHAELIKKKNIPLVFTAHLATLLCVPGTAMRWGRIACYGDIAPSKCAACWATHRNAPRVIALLLSLIPGFIARLANNWNNRLGTILAAKDIINRRRNYLHHFFDMIDHLVVVSRWLKQAALLNGVPSSKISVCLHGLPEASRPLKNINHYDIKRRLRIGFIGRYDPIKGVHVLLRAIRKLPPSFSVEVRLYGKANSEEEKKYLNSLNKMAGRDERILFCGELNDQNREAIMGELDILAAPSLCLETGPLVVLEAFAAKIPVLGSDIGGIAEMVSHGVNGLLIKPGDIRAWANAITFVGTNRYLLKQWVDSMPPIRSTQEVAEDMMGIYNRVIQK